MHSENRELRNDIEILSHQLHITQVDISAVCADHLLILLHHVGGAQAAVDAVRNVRPVTAVCAHLHAEIKVALGVHVCSVVK